MQALLHLLLHEGAPPAAHERCLCTLYNMLRGEEGAARRAADIMALPNARQALCAQLVRDQPNCRFLRWVDQAWQGRKLGRAAGMGALCSCQACLSSGAMSSLSEATAVANLVDTLGLESATTRVLRICRILIRCPAGAKCSYF